MSKKATLLVAAERVQRAQLWLAVCALVILMMVTVCDVFLRYIFNAPIRGSYDLVETMLLVFVFNGMPAAFFGRRNIVIDVIDSLVGQRFRALLIHVADVLSVLCLGLMIWAMVVPATQSYQYADLKLELRLPIYVLWIVAFIGMAGTIFCAFVTLVAKPINADGGRTE
jgi:TRAP-type transport system small permease protein